MMEAVTTEQDCRRLLRAAFPRLAARSVRYLAAGWDSTTFVVDETDVFRFPMRAAVEATLLVESRLLPELAPTLPLPVPRFSYWSGPCLDYPWHFAGYRLLPGRPMAELPPSDVPGDALAGTLAPFLAALHRFPVERAAALGVPAFTPERWLERYRRLYQQARPLVAVRLGPRLAARFTDEWEARLSDPACRDFVPSLVHGDLSGDHVLIDVTERRITGVIDFGDVMIGDPTLDYAGFDGGPSERLAELSGIAADDGFWLRRALYRHAGPLHAIDAGTQLGRPELIESGLEAVRRQLGVE